MSESIIKKHHEGHRARLKKRFKEEPLSLEDYEVLELLLGYVLLRRDTKPLAKELLNRFQSINGLMNARADEITDISGFGPSLMTFWLLLKELLSRHAEAPVRRREILATPTAVAKMAKARLAGLEQEECWLALVDQQNRLIYWGQLLRGRIGNVPIKPRDVFEEALRRKASGFILAHNHPGGNPAPSSLDIILTKELKSLSPAVGLRFLDHIIITDKDCYSLTKECLLL